MKLANVLESGGEQSHTIGNCSFDIQATPHGGSLHPVMQFFSWKPHIAVHVSLRGTYGCIQDEKENGSIGANPGRRLPHVMATDTSFLMSYRWLWVVECSQRPEVVHFVHICLCLVRLSMPSITSTAEVPNLSWILVVQIPIKAHHSTASDSLIAKHVNLTRNITDMPRGVRPRSGVPTVCSASLLPKIDPSTSVSTEDARCDSRSRQ